MVPTTPLQFLLEQGPTPVRAFSSLTKRDMAAVNAAVRASGGGFAIEEHDDYDGYLSLLLSPGQEGRPAYLISGRTGAVDLAEIRGDDMIALGSGFASIGAAMTVLRPALERGSAPTHNVHRAERLIERHGQDAGLHAAFDADAAGPGARTGWSAILRAIDARNGRD